ncbi:Acyl-CoA:1-acyl-sn-glycerol-3-phosphate acyltransferase [hydrothermal vent metagenome]|uniref:Acyl-CoA:1-acyl-sn-glycerol-3-phosphate acyltransferase n=1 Tax=hydrothermal vent metagenome TaxID=652676 RepID=A0A3B1B431_9ZZZZ
MLIAAGTIVIFLFIILVWAGFRANVADWGKPWVNLLDGWFRLFLKYYHRYHYEPVELPEQGAVLLAGNHVSGLDPLLIIAACRRPVRFMVAREEYERFGLRWFFRAGGCIPVERKGQPEKAFREALMALKRGEVVGIFPEGAIHLSSHPPRRLKRGVAMLAKLGDAPVYPVQVSGAAAEGHVILAVLKRGHARLRAFPPLNCAALGQTICLEQLGKLLRAKERVTSDE